MGIVHIVLFQLKESASKEQAQDVITRMLALQTACVHPTTKETYVKSIIGGSIEGLQRGITHAFVAEFQNAEDRQYYVKKDPAHQAFVKSLGPVVEKAQVVDIVPGGF